MAYNLERLAALADLLDHIPPERFDMEFYQQNAKGDIQVVPQIPECGTVACALGYAPLLFPPKTQYLCYDEYCEDFLGISYFDPTWDWCFSASWSGVDNTPQGAAKRIRYLIEHGQAPENAEDQRYGNAPYLFSD